MQTKNNDIKTDYQKLRYQDNTQMQKDFQRKPYKDNHEIKTDYQKMTYQQNAETDKKVSKTEISRKRKKIVARLAVSCNK